MGGVNDKNFCEAGSTNYMTMCTLYILIALYSTLLYVHLCLSLKMTTRISERNREKPRQTQKKRGNQIRTITCHALRVVKRNSLSSGGFTWPRHWHTHSHLCLQSPRRVCAHAPFSTITLLGQPCGFEHVTFDRTGLLFFST